MAGKRYYPGDHDDSVIPGLPYGDGRKNDDNEPKTVTVVAMQPVEGVLPGETATVGEKRATWLIANGYATRQEDYAEAHPDTETGDPSPDDPEE